MTSASRSGMIRRMLSRRRRRHAVVTLDDGEIRNAAGELLGYGNRCSGCAELVGLPHRRDCTRTPRPRFLSRMEVKGR